MRASTPVSSRTSRAAVASGRSPACGPPFGQRRDVRAPGGRDHEHLVAAHDDAAEGLLALSRHSRAAPPGRARSGARGPG